MHHTFHIPVLGLGYSIDTPLKVARFGISSVVSIVDDELTERMREFHCRENGLEFNFIAKSEPDSRARRITAYLNLLHELVTAQFTVLKELAFDGRSEICKYFELLPDSSILRQEYHRMLAMTDPRDQYALQQKLRSRIVAGAIDVNIMSKVDKANFDAQGENLGEMYTDALAALRGFANSDLQSSVVISAGLNPRLYAYLENFRDFYPDYYGRTHKKIILKVSDFRSATIQAKVLAKRGIWVSEFRIESGLNCGGHAFATDGLLLGPILEEFKQKRSELQQELFTVYSHALVTKAMPVTGMPVQRITVQGGIGTATENEFLANYYQLDGTGWGSPFLLVPEATNVDEETLHQLAGASADDYYLSNSSPLGVLFNNFRKSSSEQQRLQRIAKGRPGSPCTKKFLCSNTEFTGQPICTASREYQHLKIKELEAKQLPQAEFERQFESVTEKVCLCEGLCASVYLKNDMIKPKESRAVSICPGPNLSYFSSIYTLKEMVDHIYGRYDLLQRVSRPHVFVNELKLYVDYFKKDVSRYLGTLDDKKVKYFVRFESQLTSGIAYYRQLFTQLDILHEMGTHLSQLNEELTTLAKTYSLRPV